MTHIPERELDGAIHGRLFPELLEAERKAWDALCRYKFWMFGYWAAQWVLLNRVGRFKRPNPWIDLVKFARDQTRQKEAA